MDESLKERIRLAYADCSGIASQFLSFSDALIGFYLHGLTDEDIISLVRSKY